jgi:uncharacterized membrane protein (DUF106 family)
MVLEFFANIPLSTLFVFLLAIGISLLTTSVNRVLTKPDQSKAWRREISEWNKEMREAQKSGDKKQMDKVMKRQQYIFKIQSKMMWQSMKVTLLFLVPLLIIWQFIGGFYGITPVAYLPGIGANLPLPFFNISLIWWYFLCSLFFGTVFSHVFGMVEVVD